MVYTIIAAFFGKVCATSGSGARKSSTAPPFSILGVPQDSKDPNPRAPGESTESHRALAAKIILDVVSAAASEDVPHV